MQRNLYLVCPIGFSESYIQRKFGMHHYFLTALGSVFQFQEVRFIEAVADFLRKGQVEEINLVHNLDCPLKKKIIGHSQELDSRAEKQLFDLYIDHYDRINRCESEREKVRELALLHMERFIPTLAGHPLLARVIAEEGIRMNGMLIDTQAQKIEYLPAETWTRSVYSVN
jgi:hypothetical protein